MARIGIYGGTFNPPHIGHIRAAQHAVQALGLDELLLVPDRIAPHKVIPSGTANPQQRLEMVRLAAKDLDKAKVLDLELKREGPSYTYLTMEELKQQYPHDELVLLMGTDMFLSLMTWKNPEIILSHAALGVFYLAIAAIWHLPYGDEVNATIVAVATLLGTTLEIATGAYLKKKGGTND